MINEKEIYDNRKSLNKLYIENIFCQNKGDIINSIMNDINNDNIKSKKYSIDTKNGILLKFYLKEINNSTIDYILNSINKSILNFACLNNVIFLNESEYFRKGLVYDFFVFGNDVCVIL